MLNKSRTRTIVACLLAATLGAVAAVASAAGGPSQVAPWVKKATKVGSSADNLSVVIAVHMALRNSASLQTLATNISSPSSPQYGQYLTAPDFESRFAPANSDVNAVRALLENAGMTNVEVGPFGVYVSATATVRQLRATFHVSQDTYFYRGKALRANKEEPILPAALAAKILYVQGLDDSTALRQPFHHSVVQGRLAAPTAAAAAAKPAVTPPPVAANLPSPFCNDYFGSSALVATLSTAAGVYGAAIPWLNCGYTPQQIRAAYGLNKTRFDGAGITVAITDAYASPTLLADSNRYAANHGLPKLVAGKNFSQIIPKGIYNVSPDESCDPYGWWTEQSLDMAAVHGAAPGAKILYVGSRDCETSLDVAFFNTVYNHVADVVTNSWGIDGEAIAPGSQAAYDQAAMAGAAQGVTVLFSSGDDGDVAAVTGVASGSWPSTSSWVTGVGGTTLEIKNAAGAKAEHGWGTYRDYLADATVRSARRVTTSGLVTTSAFGYTFDAFEYFGGAGGGISLLESQPHYQAAAVPIALATTLNLASGYTETLPTKRRVSPDVAMVADPYTGYLYGQTYTIAGDPISDAGCKKISATTEYCEIGIGGTSLSSPLMAGVVAVMNQKRASQGEPLVGFANPLFYSLGSRGDGANFTTAALNQIVAPPEPMSLLRGYAGDPTRIRVITVNSVPFLFTTAPYALLVCGAKICDGLNDVFNYTSLSNYAGTPAGYNDVAGLGVPYLPKLINAE